ncbi:hypothetical protein FNF29_08113 [Cafeteria roenbergensis]|uniref:SET domain-containing protein n=1 Tax=Cafeteria roenbergensis TaxID=33653 RepID=A0A5A8C2J9_CAFRO|nr:hypothetical protein FNF29_08113 [Cafeteria roenbergensis]|eukprot:KAA0146340.1 hypothetical protein FNF29_08113 [Cafeteria roenbergensis]
MAAPVTANTPKEDPAMVALEAAADFVFIDENEYRVPRTQRVHPRDESYGCGCRVGSSGGGEICVSSECINRASRTECIVGSCSKKRCGNKRIQRRTYADVAVIETPGKGRGLKALGPIAEGDLVLEYVGEMISGAEMARRLAEQDKGAHFYMMAVGASYLDAGQRGGLARFINHSCQPNAEAQIWDVAGEKRVGIFALCAIAAGEELCFDYNPTAAAGGPVLGASGWYAGRVVSGAELTEAEATAAGWGATGREPDEHTSDSGAAEADGDEALPGLEADGAEGEAAAKPPSSDKLVLQLVEFMLEGGGRVRRWERLLLTANDPHADDDDNDDEDDDEDDEVDDDGGDGGGAAGGAAADSAGAEADGGPSLGNDGPGRSARWHVLEVFHTVEAAAAADEDALSTWSDPDATDDEEDEEEAAAAAARHDPLMIALVRRTELRSQRGLDLHPPTAAAAAAASGERAAPSRSGSPLNGRPGAEAAVSGLGRAADGVARADAPVSGRVAEDAQALARRLADEARRFRQEEAAARAQLAEAQARRAEELTRIAKASQAERLRTSLELASADALKKDEELRRAEAEARASGASKPSVEELRARRAAKAARRAVR